MPVKVSRHSADANAAQTKTDGFKHFEAERYKNCDWGDLDEEDKMTNDEALKCGDRLLAAYKNAEKDWKIWIITEADRKTTTILFPEEY